MKLSDFDYHLPPDRIAQHPAAERDGSRLMVLDRAARAAGDATGHPASLRHAHFHDLPAFLRTGDLLIANDTRVLPARLFARVVVEDDRNGPSVHLAVQDGLAPAVPLGGV